MAALCNQTSRPGSGPILHTYFRNQKVQSDTWAVSEFRTCYIERHMLTYVQSIKEDFFACLVADAKDIRFTV